MAILPISLLCISCSEDEPFSTVSPDDNPIILSPLFPDRVNGELPVVSNINRDANFKMEVTVTPADYTEVVWYIDGNEAAKGDSIDVSGTSKGKGYTGPILRWNQHTGPMAHGSKYHRGVGSLSANSDPSRVFKNKHMPGHYGVERTTIQNLTVVKVDAERDLLLVRGAVPGPNGGLLLVRNSVKA